MGGGGGVQVWRGEGTKADLNKQLDQVCGEGG